jgi:uncharacterized protein YwgA
MTTLPGYRYGLIAHLAEKMPQDTALGRTALMKLIYFLQTVKKVPLGYRFSLYTYGPFDSEVLADLTQVQEQGGVVSKTVYYPNGYGYEIRPGEHAADIQAPAKEFLQEHETAIQAVIQEFGKLSPADLELASTLVFASLEAEGKLSKDELAQRVKQIKPRFTPGQIKEQLESLAASGYLPA